MSGLLEGRVAVVTGGAQGLGLAVARTFVEHGARVLLGDLDESALDKAVDELGGGEHARGLRCDVSDGEQVAGLVAAAQELGSLDVLVNNAGITRDATLRTMTEEQFDDVVRVHLKGCWLGLKHAVPVMRAQERGTVVNMSSIAGKVGNIGQTNYAAAKAGIVGMTKAAAKESARYGVRVNAIQPGIIRTAMTEAMPAHVWEAKVADIPMGRVGEPSEIASVALFLASDLSSYMTGTVTEVTGGRLM